MLEIGTPKIGSNIMNLHIKRPRITVYRRIGSRKEAISGSHICKIEDKKTAYNEGCLYMCFKKALVFFGGTWVNVFNYGSTSMFH